MSSLDEEKPDEDEDNGEINVGAKKGYSNKRCGKLKYNDESKEQGDGKSEDNNEQLKTLLVKHTSISVMTSPWILDIAIC